MIHFCAFTDVMKTLKNPQKQHLKKLAHALKPVVMLGDKGLTDPVLIEVERGLDDHELIKVKLNAGDREQRKTDIAQISTRTGAIFIQRVGNIAVFYRRHPDKTKIRLPA